VPVQGCTLPFLPDKWVDKLASPHLEIRKLNWYIYIFSH